MRQLHAGETASDRTEHARAWLQRASESLQPVALELGPERVRADAYVERVDGDGVVLSQLPPELLEGQFAQTRILGLGDERWCIAAGQLERAEGLFGRVSLLLARVEEVADGELRQGTDLLVMVIPGGLPGSSSFVFPIVRVGADACEIRASVALPPGQMLEQVEIVGDRRLLRRACAQIQEVRPWYLPNGARAFGMRLLLTEQEEVEGPRREHDLVSSAHDVTRLLKLAAMTRARGHYEAPGRARGLLSVLELGASDLTFELAAVPSQALDGEPIRVGLDLFASQYELDVRTLSHAGERLRTAMPLILRRRRKHRRDQRIAVAPPHTVELRFRNPVTGAVQGFVVTEASFFALEVVCPVHGTVLWRGLPLEQAQLLHGDRVIHLGDVVVEQVEPHEQAGWARCLVHLQSSSVADDPDMIFLMASLMHPHVRVHDGRDFAAMHAIYVRAGLFGPHMHRNLEPIFEQTRDVWRKLHSGAADVMRTFIHGTDEQPEAAVTVMRAWEHAWVAQHFVDTSGERSGAAGRLQTAYLDHLVPRPDARYLLFFVKVDNHIMNAYLRRFFEGTGTPEAVFRSNVELWIGRAGAEFPAWSPGLSLRPLVAADHALVYRAAQRWFGLEAAAALSFSPEELELPDTSVRFAGAGLERGRVCSLVCRGGVPLYALIEERSTPGANLTWMLNATWILPMQASIEASGDALTAALDVVLQRAPQSATGEYFLNLPAGLPEEVLQQAGFAREAALYLYVLNRAGLHRFLNYAAERYGELDAISQHRKTRAVRSGSRALPASKE